MDGFVRRSERYEFVSVPRGTLQEFYLIDGLINTLSQHDRGYRCPNIPSPHFTPLEFGVRVFHATLSRPCSYTRPEEGKG